MSYQDLITAIKEDDVLRIAILLQHEEIVDSLNIKEGMYPLETAILYKNITAISMLLDHGANPNAMSRGRSLFTIACKRAPLDIIKILIDKGAKFDVYNAIEDSPVYVAWNASRYDIVEFFFKNHKKETFPLWPHILLRACVFDHQHYLIEHMLANGLNPDTVFSHGDKYYTALIRVCTAELLEPICGEEVNKSVRLLTKYGADPNLKNSEEKSALDIARERQDHILIEFLKTLRG